MRLGIALDPARSAFGDEFMNAPSFLGKRPPLVQTQLSGWIEIRFEEPDGGRTRFSLDYRAVGTDEELLWGGGQRFALLRNRLKPMTVLPGGVEGWTGGVLDLTTGVVAPGSVRISAAFQNSLIAAVGARSRIPFFFPFHYPAPQLPIAGLLPPGTSPPELLPEHGSLEFQLGPDGEITGVAVQAETNVPVSLFPLLGLFPPFSFGPNGKFFFAHPTSSLPGTPARICPNPEEQADGIHLPFPAYFHPHLKLVSESVREPRRTPAPRATPPAGRDRAAVVALGRKLFCFGGFDEDNQVSARGLVYDFEAATWQECAPLPIAVAAAGAVAIGGEILVIGGWTDNEQTATDAVQVYHVNAGTWSSAAPLPVAAATAATAAFGNEVYVAGGWAPALSGSVSDLLHIYDRAADRWSIGPEMLLPVADAAAVFVGDELYVINGRLDRQTLTNRVSVLQAGSDRWGLGPSTSRGVYQAAVAMTARRVLLLGGRSTINGATAPSLQQLELEGGLWREGMPPLLGTAGSGAAVIGDTVMLVWGRSQTGAETDPGRVTDLVQTLDPGSAWRTDSQRPVFSASDVFNAGAGVLAPRELSPGGRAFLVGHNLLGQPAAAQHASDVKVSIDGLPATIVRCESDRIELVVPPVKVSERGVRLAHLQVIPPAGADYARGVDVPVIAAAPNLFVLSFTASGFDEYALREPRYLEDASALAANEDGTLNCPYQPEVPGGLISLLATGLGRLPEDLSTPGALPEMSATIDGQAATIERVSAVPGHPGVYALSLRIPAGISVHSNLHRVALVSGKTEANPVTISIQASAIRPAPALDLAHGAMTVLGPGSTP